MIKVGLSGAMGKMGRTIASVIASRRDLKLVLALEKKSHPSIGAIYPVGNSGIKVSEKPDDIEGVDVLIDFSVPSATIRNLEFCKKFKTNIVIGTTGFTSGEYNIIKRNANFIAVLLSPNMSPGINLLFSILRKVAGHLRKAYDVEIIDIHHRYKKDAPSGTAKKFADILKGKYKKEIPIHSLRVGEVFGDHSIIFAGNKERIEFVHKATTREVFAEGAVMATYFISRKKKGLFSMEDLFAHNI